MTPQSEANLNEAINWLQQTGSKVESFTIEQAPIYCKEIVDWTFYEGIFWSIIGAVLLASIPIWWKLTKAIWKTGHYGNPTATIPALIGTIAFMLGIVCAANGPTQAIKASVAPRVVIIEHLRSIK